MNKILILHDVYYVLLSRCLQLPKQNMTSSKHVMRGSRKFVRGGPTLITFIFSFSFFFSLMRGEDPKYHYWRANTGPPAKRHLNGVLLACRWWPNFECWLGSFVIFRESGSLLLRNFIFLWFSQGGGGGSEPHVPPLDPHLHVNVTSLCEYDV